MKIMHSLRTKIITLSVCITVIAVAVVSLMSVLFIKRTEHGKSNQLLLLLCETGERNLDYYFNSVEKSVKDMKTEIIGDIISIKSKDNDEELKRHVERMQEKFDRIASKTNGVLTYYYRIDPAFNDSEPGFWYTNLKGTGFEKHDVTDIREYDTEDTSSLVWFTVPKYQGKAIWLPPYYS